MQCILIASPDAVSVRVFLSFLIVIVLVRTSAGKGVLDVRLSAVSTCRNAVAGIVMYGDVLMIVV